MLAFKSFSSASVMLPGVETVHMMRKRQVGFALKPVASHKAQCEAIAA